NPKISGGGLAIALSAALAAATLVWLALMVAKQRTIARVVGVLTVPTAIAMLFAFARIADESLGLSFFQLLAGAAFTGAVLDGLLLGHWYLTDRRLPRGPINRMAWILVGAVALDLAAVVAGGSGSVIIAIAVVGTAAVFVAWRLVATGRTSVWLAVAPAEAAAGLAALASGRTPWSPMVAPGWAALAGLGSGAGLYVATAGFVLV